MKHLAISCLYLLFLHTALAQQAVYISTEHATADIEQLVTTFENVHYNPYFNTSKQDFDRIKNERMSWWAKDSIPFKEFMVTGMKLTAMMSGGHSEMNWKNAKILPEIKAHTYLPFTGHLVMNEDTSFVVTRSHISSIEPGMVIKSINGWSAVELYKECMSYTGGVDAFRNANIEKMFSLYLFFNDALQAPYQIEVQSLSETVQMDGIDIYELANFINSAQVRDDYTFEILPSGIGLITYNSCSNYKKFKTFLKQAFKTIDEENIEKLIIDIRENGGGDSSLNDLLLAYITTKPYQQASGRYWKVSEEAKKAYAENDVYQRMFGKAFMEEYMNTPNQEVIASIDSSALTYPEQPKHYFHGASCMLIGPSTFSSANFLADAVKTYNLTTLIGLPTGEYTNDFGEQLSFTLKYSESTVYISSTYDIGANGNDKVLDVVHPHILVKSDALHYAIDWLSEEIKNE